jgi:hypothetical protein
MKTAIETYLADVREGRFPNDSESFHMESVEDVKRLYGGAVVVPMPKAN